jgi:hypothetical protein
MEVKISVVREFARGAYGCDNPLGCRKAVVLGVDAAPGADKPLHLDSREIIAQTQMLNRLANRSDQDGSW